MSTRVFMVEDDEAIAAVVAAGAKREGWELTRRALVEGSFEAIVESKPSLVLLDVGLPDGNGIELCRRLRAEPATALIPVIIMTTRGSVEDRVKGFEAGAQDYVPKPFELAELLARARAHLSVKVQRDALETQLVKKNLEDRVRQDVVDMVVHDLRAPLTTVKITLELLGKSGLITQAPLTKFMGYANQSLDFTLLMVNDLLDLGAGRLKPKPEPLDLALLAQKTERFIEVQAGAKGVKVEFSFPETSTSLSTDGALLFRVLVNVLTNALKFSKSGQRIKVGAAVTQSSLRLEVADEGPGIPDQEKEAVFDKYYRAKNSETMSVAGSGIGLAFCRLAATALGGRIWVEDAKPTGCRFVLEVPPLEAAG